MPMVEWHIMQKCLSLWTGVIITSFFKETFLFELFVIYALQTFKMQTNLVCVMKGWNQALEMAKQKNNQWALYAKAFLDRTRLALASKGEQYYNLMQPSAEYLGSLLNIDQWAVRA